MSTCLYPFHPQPKLPQSLLAAPPLRQRAAMANVRWPTGGLITVGVLPAQIADDWGQHLRAAVRQYAAEWTQYANLAFAFVDTWQGADVTVNLQPAREAPYGTYSSLLGTECRYASSEGEASTHLVFDPHDPANTDQELGRVIRHEFGHVLGLIHEHERPDRPLVWDLPAVLAYYEPLTGWSEADIQQQVIEPYAGAIVAETNWDPTSIMMYPVPPGLATVNGQPFSVGWNLVLSDRDKRIAAAMYPRSVPAIGQSPPPPAGPAGLKAAADLPGPPPPATASVAVGCVVGQPTAITITLDQPATEDIAVFPASDNPDDTFTAGTT
jgi:hypothetical protein